MLALMLCEVTPHVRTSLHFSTYSTEVVCSFTSGYCAPHYYPWYGGYYGYFGYAYYWYYPSYYGYGLGRLLSALVVGI
jgi:hypothetical protein